MPEVELRDSTSDGLLMHGQPAEADPRAHEFIAAGRLGAPQAKTILVVDDEAAIREVVATVLQFRGYNVLRAADGAAGLEHLQQQPVDLLITDIQMPVLDGCELARRARAMRPGLPILFMSGRIAEMDLGPHGGLGCTTFLSKPFCFSGLMSEVEDLLRRAGADVRPVLTAI